MRRKVKLTKFETSIEINDSYQGETIEEKIERIVNNGEPITDSAPLIYTERKDGVKAEYNIRTDRFDLAVEAMDYVSRSNTAKRMQKLEKSSENESTQATSNGENNIA